MEISNSRRNSIMREDGNGQMFVELFKLSETEEVVEWTASARWIKYEEDTEGVDNHWSRPHVSFLRLKSLTTLKNVILKGSLIFDPPNVTHFDQILHTLASQMMRKFDMTFVESEQIASLLLHAKNRRPDHKINGRFTRKLSSSTAIDQSVENKVHPTPIVDYNMNEHRKGSLRSTVLAPPLHVSQIPEEGPAADETAPTSPMGVNSPHHASKAMKRVFSFRRRTSFTSLSEFDHHLQALFDSDSIQITQIFVVEQPKFSELRLVGVRLVNGQQISDVLKGNGKIRFIFLLFGPPTPDLENYDVGRALGVMLTNKVFQHVAMAASSKAPLITTIDNILNDMIVVPQLEIDQQDLLNVEDQKTFVNKRRGIFRNNSILHMEAKNLIEEHTQKCLEEKMQLEYTAAKIAPHPFQRTGRPFGGVMNDLKHRLPYYLDDFRQALNFQCFTSILYIFFANFASAVAIGDVLGKKTDEWFGVSEILVSHALAGVVWGLFAGQPLCIVAAVGPLMVFEDGIYQICKALGTNFLATRFWIGLWSFIFLVILAMVESPFLMRYLTRFTEDIFTGLIAFIFFWEAVKFIVLEFINHPVGEIDSYCKDSYDDKDPSTPQIVQMLNFSSQINATDMPYVKPNVRASAKIMTNQPNTALLELILFYLTFILAFQMRKFRTGIFCDRRVKRGIGDFAVPLAVFIVALIDAIMFGETYTKHLEMKRAFGLTKPDARSWIVNPMGTEASPFPTWMILVSIIPAILVTILMYLEVEIVENLLLKKEHCLVKPSGFHWDLIVMGALTFLCPVFGLQWVCPAAVQSIAHAQSLSVMKKTAPGEAAQIDYVLEQRVTAILIAVLHGMVVPCVILCQANFFSYAHLCGVSFLSVGRWFLNSQIYKSRAPSGSLTPKTAMVNFYSLFLGLAACLGFVLVFIPSSALFGLFLFLGVIGLMNIQLWNRILLIFMPSKYFPKQPYCMDVSTKRLHLFTFLQLLCFVGLYSVNIFRQSAIAFPVVLIVIALVRHLLFPKIFTEHELIVLDGIPQSKTIDLREEDLKSDEGR